MDKRTSLRQLLRPVYFSKEVKGLRPRKVSMLCLIAILVVFQVFSLHHLISKRNDWLNKTAKNEKTPLVSKQAINRMNVLDRFWPVNLMGTSLKRMKLKRTGSSSPLSNEKPSD